MEFRVLVAGAHRAGQAGLEGTALQAAGLRQPGIHRARMTSKLLAAVAAASSLMLGGCAVSPVAINSRFAVRQVRNTPDSGSVAIRCCRLIDGLNAAPLANALVVIRHGRIESVEADASRADEAAPHVPVLNLSGYTCLP